MGGSSSKAHGKSSSRGSSPVSSGGNGRTRTARSGANSGQVTSKDKAVLELKNSRDRLRKYQKRLDLEAQQLHDSAKRLLQADKRNRAKLALQLKKFKEQQMQQADAQLIQVLSLLDAVEWEEQQLKVFEGLKAGNSVLDSIHKEMTIEAVEELMMETEEAQATANEISRMIGSSLTNVDEDEVLNELAEIERMEAEAQAKALAAALPEVPITPLETELIHISVKAEPKVVSVEWPEVTEMKAKVKARPIGMLV